MIINHFIMNFVSENTYYIYYILYLYNIILFLYLYLFFIILIFIIYFLYILLFLFILYYIWNYIFNEYYLNIILIISDFVTTCVRQTRWTIGYCWTKKQKYYKYFSEERVLLHVTWTISQ